MKLFFDCEFTGLHKNTTLISLGIVSEDYKTFYAEFFDYDIDQCDEWIKENVIKNLTLNFPTMSGDVEEAKRRLKKLKEKGYKLADLPVRAGMYDGFCTSITKDNITEVVGDKEWIANELKDWLKQFDSVQFVSDVCHYDFVLLIDLFGSAWDLPDNVNPACYDINQEIAREFEISQKEAFEFDREYIIFCLSGQGVRGKKHNALYDAVVIMRIYECIQRNKEIEVE